MSLNLDFSRTGGLSNTPVEYTNWRSFKNMYKGTGLSNTPVEYTNSRSFTNVYKGKGSISSSKLLQGLGTGQGMNKGHTILNTGGGLKGTSLFRLKHYNPLGGSDDDKKDRNDEKDEHKHDETDKDKKVESDEGDESGEGDEGDESDEGDEGDESDEGDEGDEGDESVEVDEGNDMHAMAIIRGIASYIISKNKKGNIMVKDTKYIDADEKIYIIQQKISGKWDIITNGTEKTHSYEDITKLTGHTNNNAFRYFGDSILNDSEDTRITWWHKDFKFTVADYYKVSKQLMS
jgi:hypothetical protein